MLILWLCTLLPLDQCIDHECVALKKVQVTTCIAICHLKWSIHFCCLPLTNNKSLFWLESDLLQNKSTWKWLVLKQVNSLWLKSDLKKQVIFFSDLKGDLKNKSSHFDLKVTWKWLVFPEICKWDFDLKVICFFKSAIF